jgi:hypothetical protein
MDDRALKLPMVFKWFFFSLSKITELKKEIPPMQKRKGKRKFYNFQSCYVFNRSIVYE